MKNDQLFLGFSFLFFKPTTSHQFNPGVQTKITYARTRQMEWTDGTNRHDKCLDETDGQKTIRTTIMMSQTNSPMNLRGSTFTVTLKQEDQPTAPGQVFMNMSRRKSMEQKKELKKLKKKKKLICFRFRSLLWLFLIL